MPPQGEAAGLALEDAVLLARVFEEYPNKTIPEIFTVYERTRRPRINAFYKAANRRWENVKDKGLAKQKLFEWMFWAFLWVKGEGHQQNMAYEVQKEKLRE
jgi:2-polyprenyl-6-methoxyphenol hydroxylase-like FAD-dependent oxidoreductase